MQAANRVELHIVLTGLDGIAAGIEQGIWEDLTPYHSIIGRPSDIYDGGAAEIQKQAGGNGMLLAFSHQGPVLDYMPSRFTKPPRPPADRKSVVSGKSVSVRVDLGGRRYIKKKTN